MAWDDLFKPGQAPAPQPEQPKGPTQVQDAGLYETLAQVKTLLEARLVPTTSKQETATLGPNVQYIYESLGYRNLTVIAPDNVSATIYFDSFGVKHSQPLAAGSNVFSGLPDGTVITASTNVGVILTRDNAPTMSGSFPDEVALTGSTAIYNGTYAVTGTGASIGVQTCSAVLVQNDPSSNGPILLGGSGNQTISLAPGSSKEYQVTNVSMIYAKFASGTTTAQLNWEARS